MESKDDLLGVRIKVVSREDSQGEVNGTFNFSKIEF